MDRGSKWLSLVKQALFSEGFKHTDLQIRKPNQVFGLVKKLHHPWEMHVRGFSNNRLEAEIEISREYLEHLDDHYRRSAVSELVEVLNRHRIPYKITGKIPDQHFVMESPPILTEWKPLVFIGIVVVLLIILAKEK